MNLMVLRWNKSSELDALCQNFFGLNDMIGGEHEDTHS
jgi:hypothetical protein